MRPLIGITCSRVVGGAWGLYSPGHFMDYTFDDYSQAVRYGGGAPVLLPVAQNRETLQTVLERLDGLILSGGPDINPKFYGEQPLEGLGEIDEGLDQMELQVAKMAFKMGLPIFAICRGIQILNVSLGGTLYQDIASQMEESINHTQKADKGVNTHSIRIQGKTLLHQILKRKVIWVNGKHHQAIKDLAKGFIVSAWAYDGIIEAIEYPDRNFVLGVQWHPEGSWREDAYSKRLFRAFTHAARKPSKRPG
ncbi:MAG: gamma-glutamyl-gamma-aminobutyrate hydrolase family protein [Thermodesulfobacteriota bacterium]|nr:gamma-glutamyl-gamma-aminobutyrate hydrolase family protein [Thermodesulfobacteriota bacterium]